MFISPMLAEAGSEPFDDDQHVFESKIDGHRLIIVRSRGRTRLFTPFGTDITDRYPELQRLPADEDMVLDGEVYCMDPDTERVDHELLLERFRLTKPGHIAFARPLAPVHCVVFDLLSLRGKLLLERPLEERKQRLELALENNHHYHKMKYVEEQGRAFFEAAITNGGAGIVAKRRDSVYESGLRSSSWLSIAHLQHHRAIIAGYRKNGTGWLLHAERNGELQPAGLLHDGLQPQQIQKLIELSKPLRRDEDHHFVYLEHEIHVEIESKGWLRDGTLRSPRLIAFLL